jgi:hypothetical protein
VQKGGEADLKVNFRQAAKNFKIKYFELEVYAPPCQPYLIGRIPRHQG